MYCNKEGCRTSRFRVDDKELCLGHVKPREGVHQALGCLSLEFWGDVWALGVNLGSISRLTVFKAKRQDDLTKGMRQG